MLWYLSLPLHSTPLRLPRAYNVQDTACRLHNAFGVRAACVPHTACVRARDVRPARHGRGLLCSSPVALHCSTAQYRRTVRCMKCAACRSSLAHRLIVWLLAPLPPNRHGSGCERLAAFSAVTVGASSCHRAPHHCEGRFLCPHLRRDWPTPALRWTATWPTHSHQPTNLAWALDRTL